MKFTKLALASVAAFGLAGVASADTYYVQDGLETLGDGVSPRTGYTHEGPSLADGAVWFGGADTDETAVTAYDGNLPAEYKLPTISGSPMTAGDYYLKVSNSSPLWRLIKEGGYGKVNDEWPTTFPANMDVEVGSGLYIDTLVQFTPSEDPPETEEGSKLVVWMNTNGVLCVTAGLVSYDGVSSPLTIPTHFVTTTPILTNTWYRLTVSAYQDVDSSEDTEFTLNGFTVSIDGTLVTATTAVADAGFLESDFADETYLSSDVAALMVANQFFGSLEYNKAGTLAAVGFRGEGLVDDIVISDVLPTFTGGPSGIDFTLVWDTGVSAVWYAIDGGDPVGAVSGSPIELADGSTIEITAEAAPWYAIDASSIPATPADGQTYTITATEAATGGAAGVEGDLAGFTAAQLKAAFPDATPAQVNSAANAYLDYQFGQALNTLSAAPTLKIVDIAQNAEDATLWDIKVQVLNGKTPMAIDNGEVAKTTPLKAALKVIAAATLAGLDPTAADTYDLTYDSTATDLTVTVPAADGQFFKAYIQYAVPANN